MSKVITGSKGKAFARRIDGNVYCVTYDRSKAMDRDVSGRYLRELVEAGYEVVCDDGWTGRLDTDGGVRWDKTA